MRVPLLLRAFGCSVGPRLVGRPGLARSSPRRLPACPRPRLGGSAPAPGSRAPRPAAGSGFPPPPCAFLLFFVFGWVPFVGIILVGGGLSSPPGPRIRRGAALSLGVCRGPFPLRGFCRSVVVVAVPGAVVPLPAPPLRSRPVLLRCWPAGPVGWRLGPRPLLAALLAGLGRRPSPPAAGALPAALAVLLLVCPPLPRRRFPRGCAGRRLRPLPVGPRSSGGAFRRGAAAGFPSALRLRRVGALLASLPRGPRRPALAARGAGSGVRGLPFLRRSSRCPAPGVAGFRGRSLGARAPRRVGAPLPLLLPPGLPARAGAGSRVRALRLLRLRRVLGLLLLRLPVVVAVPLPGPGPWVAVTGAPTRAPPPLRRSSRSAGPAPCPPPPSPSSRPAFAPRPPPALSSPWAAPPVGTRRPCGLPSPAAPPCVSSVSGAPPARASPGAPCRLRLLRPCGPRVCRRSGGRVGRLRSPCGRGSCAAPSPASPPRRLAAPAPGWPRSCRRPGRRAPGRRCGLPWRLACRSWSSPAAPRTRPASRPWAPAPGSRSAAPPPGQPASGGCPRASLPSPWAARPGASACRSSRLPGIPRLLHGPALAWGLAPRRSLAPRTKKGRRLQPAPLLASPATRPIPLLAQLLAGRNVDAPAHRLRLRHLAAGNGPMRLELAQQLRLHAGQPQGRSLHIPQPPRPAAAPHSNISCRFHTPILSRDLAQRNSLDAHPPDSRQSPRCSEHQRKERPRCT